MFWRQNAAIASEGKFTTVCALNGTGRFVRNCTEHRSKRTVRRVLQPTGERDREQTKAVIKLARHPHHLLADQIACHKAERSTDQQNPPRNAARQVLGVFIGDPLDPAAAIATAPPGNAPLSNGTGDNGPAAGAP